jgi:hypothetical protein
VQRADRIQLLGQLLGYPAYSPQVSRSIAYATATLAVQPATSTRFAVLPSLLTANGGSDPQAFAQITPEAYASATQIAVENALAVTNIARGPASRRIKQRRVPSPSRRGSAAGIAWAVIRLSASHRPEPPATAFSAGVDYGDRD